jgi:hypothetical protein
MSNNVTDCKFMETFWIICTETGTLVDSKGNVRMSRRAKVSKHTIDGVIVLAVFPVRTF